MDTRVSLYDKVSSLLVALVVMFGFAAICLLIIWLTKVIQFDDHVAEPAPMFELAVGDEAVKGVADDFEEPGVEELPDVSEPQLADAVEALTDAVSSQRANYEAIEGNAELTGTGTGLGDARKDGTGGLGDGGRPPWDRWKIRFTTTSQRAYADQLDAFKIELAAVSQTTQEIKYASNLGAGQPTVREGTRAQYNKSGGILFLHTIRALKNFDLNLLGKAKVATRDRNVGWYLPPATNQQLSQLEAAALASKGGGKEVSDILETVFAVQAQGGGYAFYVAELKTK